MDHWNKEYSDFHTKNVSMEIQLLKCQNKYGFVVGKFNSFRNYVLVPKIQPYYDYAWVAYRDAISMLKKPSHLICVADYGGTVIDLSADEMLTDHYDEIYHYVAKRVKNSGKDPKERKIVFEEVYDIINDLDMTLEQMEDPVEKRELKGIKAKFEMLSTRYFPDLAKKKKEEEAKAQEMMNVPPPVAPLQPIPQMASTYNIIKIAEGSESIQKSLVAELLEAYGERICRAIEHKHPDAIYKVFNNAIHILDKGKTGYKPIINVSVNNNLVVNSVLPLNSLSEINPFHSTDFYQKYWKPIVASIGHFYIDDDSLLLVHGKSILPDVPAQNASKHKIRAINTLEKKEKDIILSFDKINSGWFFNNVQNVQIKTAVSSYTEADYLNARVQCVDPEQQSILGKIGYVVQVIPRDGAFIEVDVNFGRRTIRMSEDQIKILPEL